MPTVYAPCFAISLQTSATSSAALLYRLYFAMLIANCSTQHCHLSRM